MSFLTWENAPFIGDKVAVEIVAMKWDGPPAFVANDGDEKPAFYREYITPTKELYWGEIISVDIEGQRLLARFDDGERWIVREQIAGTQKTN